MTCGTKYSYCPSCFEDRNKPTWMVMWHDENCKNIFNILNENYYGHLSTKKAILQLEACDLSRQEHLLPEIQKDIAALLAKKSKRKIVKSN